MPGMDGFETAAHVKKRERTRDIPILFLTAIGDAHQAFRGYAAGAVDYLAKPFDPWVLRAKVSVFIELYEKNRQLREQAQLLRRQISGDSGGRSPGIDREFASRLAAAEEQLAIVEKLVSEQSSDELGGAVSELAQRIARLRAGIDALNPEV